VHPNFAGAGGPTNLVEYPLQLNLNVSPNEHNGEYLVGTQRRSCACSEKLAVLDVCPVRVKLIFVNAHPVPVPTGVATPLALPVDDTYFAPLTQTVACV